VDLRDLRGVDDLLEGGAGLRVADVVGDAHLEEQGLLEHDAELPAHARLRDVLHVDAVDPHGALLHVVEAHEQRENRRLAAPRGADQRDRLAGLDVDVEVVEDDLARLVPEGDLVEVHLAAHVAFEADGAGPLGDFRAGLEDLEEPVRRDAHVLELLRELREAHRRPEDLHGVSREGRHVAVRRRVREHHRAAEEVDARAARVLQQHRVDLEVRRGGPADDQVVHQRHGLAVEDRLLALLRAVRLDREVRDEAVLDAAREAVLRAAHADPCAADLADVEVVVADEQDEDGEDRQRQPPVEVQRGAHGEERADEVGDHLHRGDVEDLLHDRAVAHEPVRELARAVLLEVADVHAEHVPVHGHADLEHEGLPDVGDADDLDVADRRVQDRHEDHHDRESGEQRFAPQPDDLVDYRAG